MTDPAPCSPDCPCCSTHQARVRLAKQLLRRRLDGTHPDVRAVVRALDGATIHDLMEEGLVR